MPQLSLQYAGVDQLPLCAMARLPMAKLTRMGWILMLMLSPVVNSGCGLRLHGGKLLDAVLGKDTATSPMDFSL